MKTLELLQNLPPGARRYLDFVMNSHGRKSLQNLYLYLQNGAGQDKLGKELLYEAAFGDAYRKEKDYLLRNELRLLNEEIEKVAATFFFQKAYDANANLKALWDGRAALQMGQDIWRELPKSMPEKHFSYDQASLWADLLELILKRQLEMGEMDPKHIAPLLEGADRLLEWRRVEAARKLAQAAMIRNGAGRWAKKNTGADADWRGEVLWDLEPVLSQDPIAAFLFWQFRAQLLEGEQQIAALSDSLEWLGRCIQSRHFDRASLEMSLNSVVALQLYLNGEYGRAAEYYSAALAVAPDQKNPLLMSVVANSMSNLLKLGNYRMAAALARKYSPLFVEHPQAAYPMQALTAICHIWEGDTKQALACIPADVHQRPGNTYVLFRFVQVMVFGVWRDWEGGEREAGNLCRMLQYWRNAETTRDVELEMDFWMIARWFQRYFHIMGGLENQISAELDVLEGQIQAERSVNGPLFADFHATQWLLAQIGKGKNG